jgi:hypothetical protein
MKYSKSLRQLGLTGVFLAATILSSSAQSNDQLDELLSESPARLDSSLYLVLTSTSLLPESGTPDEAFQAAVVSGLVPKGRAPGDPMTVQDLAYLLMKTLKVPGGLEWSLLPSARAAYRELAFHDLINTSAGPNRTMAGDEVVRTLDAVSKFRGDRR